MGDSATAMRDPIFYRWHAFVDDVFQEHKNTLPQYTVQQVKFILTLHFFYHTSYIMINTHYHKMCIYMYR